MYHSDNTTSVVNNHLTKGHGNRMIVSVLLEGTLPLICHSQRAMNYRDPLAQELSSLNSKRGKTLEDRLRISDLEMELGLYYDYEKGGMGPYVPAFNIKRCIQDGGKSFKLGKHVQQALRSLPGQDHCPLLYDGPRDIPGLLESAAFRDVRTVGISGRTVERTRPIFNNWKIEARFVLDHERMDLTKFRTCVRRAGEYVGMGDFRPEYGTFVCRVEEVTSDVSDRVESGLTTV